MLLLSIPLLPHYAILSGLVVVVHWYWLFFLKDKTNKTKNTVATISTDPAVAPSGETRTTGTVASSDHLTGNHVDHSLFTSVQSEDSIEKSQAVTPDLLRKRHAGKSIITLLDKLDRHDLDPDSQEYLNALAALTQEDALVYQPQQLNLSL